MLCVGKQSYWFIFLDKYGQKLKIKNKSSKYITCTYIKITRFLNKPF